MTGSFGIAQGSFINHLELFEGRSTVIWDHEEVVWSHLGAIFGHFPAF